MLFVSDDCASLLEDNIYSRRSRGGEKERKKKKREKNTKKMDIGRNEILGLRKRKESGIILRFLFYVTGSLAVPKTEKRKRQRGIILRPFHI